MRNHIEPLDGRTYCYIGTQDTHFGQAGLTRVTVPYSSEHASGESASTNKPTILLVDANGRSIIASKTNSTLTLRRVDAFGVNDDAFAASAAGQPMASLDQTNTSRDDVALDSSNRIYVLLGTTVTRYRSNGQVDRSFGDKGRARLSTLTRAADLDIGADGHVFVVGTTAAPINDPDKIQVIRLTADGKVDTTFATNGMFTVPVPFIAKGNFNGSADGEVVHGNADGSVVFAGRGEYSDKDSGGVVFGYHAIQTVRLDKLGRLVKAFGTRGIVTSSYIFNDAITSSNPQAVGIRSDGTVFIGNTYGTDNPDPDHAGGENTAIVAPSGSTGFLTNPGISTTIAGKFFDAPDGGSYFVNSQGLSKLNADGTAYAVFNNGKPVGSITAAAIGNNGELIVGDTGRTQFDKYYNVARYFLSTGPAATLVPAVLTSVAKSLSFTVWYDDTDGIGDTSATSRDLVVTGPAAATVKISSQTKDKATGRLIATYTLTPGHGKFTSASNGLYTVSLSGSRLGISDVQGNHAQARPIGTLVVNIA